MKNYIGALLILCGVSVFVYAAQYVTNFSKIQLDQNQILDSGGTTRVTLATSGAHITLTGEVVSTGALGIEVITSTGTDTPRAAGLLAVGTGSQLVISTGTGTGAWVKVGGQ